jgi:hypothetical protein
MYDVGVIAGQIRYLGAKRSVEVWRSGRIGSYRLRYRRRLALNECDVDDESAKDAGMIEKCRCGRVLGEEAEMLLCGVWFGSSSSLLEEGRFSSGSGCRVWK